MRKRDKLINIERANILAEQHYLKSKGLLKEGRERLDAYDRDFDFSFMSDQRKFEVTLSYTPRGDEEELRQLIGSIEINYHLEVPYGVFGYNNVHCEVYHTDLEEILDGWEEDLSKFEPLRPKLLKASVWLDKNGEDIYEGTVYDWVVREFDAEIDEFARTADFQCYNNY